MPDRIQDRTGRLGLKRIDNEVGMVRLALGRLGQTSVPSLLGVLVTVNFKVTDLATSGTCELRLNKFGLADENFQDIAGFTVQGARIKISS